MLSITDWAFSWPISVGGRGVLALFGCGGRLFKGSGAVGGVRGCRGERCRRREGRTLVVV